MGQAKSNETLARQWQLLRSIPTRGPGKTASELHKALQNEGFAVTLRTVQRDLELLSGPFNLTVNNKGTPQGWHFADAKGLNLPTLSVPEAVSLRLLEDFLRPLVPASLLAVLASRFEEARQLLATVASSNAVATWSEKVRVVPPALPLKPPVMPEGILDAVQDALLRDVQIEIGYRSAGGHTSRQRLHPLAIVQRGSVLYLIATAFDYADPHLYAMHRIGDVIITNDHVVRPSEFTIDAYIAAGGLQFGNGKQIRLRMLLDEDVAGYLQETPLSDDMTLNQKAGGWQLSATVPDSWQLRWWLLSQGAAVQVLAPAALRAEIADTVSRMSEQYREPASKGSSHE